MTRSLIDLFNSNAENKTKEIMRMREYRREEELRLEIHKTNMMAQQLKQATLQLEAVELMSQYQNLSVSQKTRNMFQLATQTTIDIVI
ncbi:hypothetical protein FR932_12280 [Moritella marina ATCC 15381]|uniref:Uncharacterized protein n=1 Tax=Moritella marina ATCC 15381 TaxID=1202962 RepID=A0A5J6WMS3_MORMI|nr:hypothetical protein [Moritella marina]QFI38571.1 hypothetical protein FR932_12280 [Moritella marina ATCC 15381]